MIIKEPETTSATELGNGVFANYGTFRRRLMASCTIPLAEVDNYVEGEPITALNTGTGQPERCQVEADWLMPYNTTGKQRCVRVTFPTIVNAQDLRHTVQFAKSAAGDSPTFTPRQSVTDGLTSLGIRFFGCGNKGTHYVDLKAVGAALPAPMLDGTRSKIYRWFGRIYEPAHAPSVQTELWAEVWIEVFHQEDYAEIYTWWGICDDRISSPNGIDRSTLSDEQSEIGFDFLIANQSAVEPVPFYRGNSTVSLSYGGGLWRWIQNQKTTYNSNGVVLDQIMPFGLLASARGVLLFAPSNADQLRIDSMNAWRARPEPVFSISDSWKQRQDAFGLMGFLPRRFKRHEHYDRTRDREYVRGRLETQAVGLDFAPPTTPANFLWYQNNGLIDHVTNGFTSAQTGGHASWNKIPGWFAASYVVPGMGIHLERYTCAWPAPVAYRKQNGDIVDPYNTSLLIFDGGLHSQRGNEGNLLGKTGLAPLNTTLRAPIIVAGANPPTEPSDQAHFENAYPFTITAMFGSRMARRLAEHIAYTAIWGTWNNAPSQVAATGQPRGFSRGSVMSAWCTWVFGADTRWHDRSWEIIYQYRYLPALQNTNNDVIINPHPNRVVKTLNLIRPNGTAGANRVELRRYAYFRPWEDAIGLLGWYGMWRLGLPFRSELAEWKRIAQEMAADSFRYGSPRIVDENTGRILFTYLRPGANGQPGSVYEPGAAVGIVEGGSRQMTQSEWLINNWELCSSSGTGNCDESNDGLARLGVPGAGTGAFTMSLAHYVMDFGGAEADLKLTRYLGDAFEHLVNRGENPGNAQYGEMIWLKNHKWHTGGEPTVIGGTTSRGNTGITEAIDCAVSISTPTSIWVVGGFNGSAPPAEMTRRINIANAAVLQDLVPTIAPRHHWSGVAVRDLGSGPVVYTLDGAVVGSTRDTPYALVATPEGGGTSTRVEFTITGGQWWDLTGLAWDGSTGSWVASAWRAGDASLVRIPPGGGVATLETSRIIPHEAHRDMLTGGVAIDSESRIMLWAAGNGTVYPYARSFVGNYWGSPRRGASMSTFCVTLSHHAREDDALRLVSLTTAGVIQETEV